MMDATVNLQNAAVVQKGIRQHFYANSGGTAVQRIRRTVDELLLEQTEADTLSWRMRFRNLFGL